MAEAPKPQRVLSTYTDHGITGKVELYVSTPSENPDRPEQQRFQLSFDEGWRLLQSLMGSLGYMSEQRMKNAVAGDCERCGNHRMVEIVKNVRPESVHCPDCYERYSGAMPAYPVLADG